MGNSIFSFGFARVREVRHIYILFFFNFRPTYLVSIGNEILVERNKMLVPAQVIDVFDLKLQGKQYLSYGKSKTFIEVLSERCTGHMVACLLTMPLHGL